MVYIYRITLKNYQGQTTIELYLKEENAIKRFEELRLEALNYPDYDDDIDLKNDSFICSYFNANYNEHNTVIILNRVTAAQLFKDWG